MNTNEEAALGAKTHMPLVKALSRCPQLQIKAGRVLFHGCGDLNRDIDVQSKRLLGTRKWLSEDPEYPVSYAYLERAGAPLLWECRLTLDAVAFVGSQSKLFEVSPWGTASIYEFPDAFERHAKAALGQDLPVLFLDHLQEDGLFRELLVPNPAANLAVEKIHHLVGSKKEAVAFALRLLPS